MQSDGPRMACGAVAKPVEWEAEALARNKAEDSLFAMESQKGKASGLWHALIETKTKDLDLKPALSLLAQAMLVLQKRASRYVSQMSLADISTLTSVIGCLGE